MPTQPLETDPKALPLRQRLKKSSYLTVFVVFMTLMTDTILYSVIVPILPKYFYLETAMEANITVNSSEARVTPATNTTRTTNCSESNEKSWQANESVQLSLLLASKQIIQIFANMVVGPVIDKIGHDVPMLFGYVVMIGSSLAFGFGESYAVLVAARAVQGIGSACAATAGMAMIAAKFRDDDERGKMLGIALGGFGMGVLVGPSFGSVSYQFGGKALPFVVIAVLSFAVGLLQAFAGGVRVGRDDGVEISKRSQIDLLKDPYVISSSVSIIIGGLAVPVIETVMPVWMMSSMCADEWMLGVVFLPGSIGFMIASLLFGYTGHKIGRWTICTLSFVVTAAGCIGMPFCRNFYELIGPVVVIGMAAGMLDASMYPIVGFLVDHQFEVPIYGSAYALADAMYCVSFTLGPLLAGILVRPTGFANTIFIVSGLTLLGLIPTAFLRKPLATNEACTSCFAENEEETVLLTERSQAVETEE